MSKERAETHVCHVSCCFYCVNTKIGSGSLVCFLIIFHNLIRIAGLPGIELGSRSSPR